MALKDLVADRGKITEEMIEKIIADYIRYDPGTYEIVLTPSGAALGNDAKILVVLVALMGWPYVVEETQSLDTRPAALEAVTGIPGGTLRPTLKKLKETHLITVVEGHYSARPANLDAIARAVLGEKVISLAKRKVRKTDKLQEPRSEADQQPTPSVEKGKKKPGVPIKASLSRLLDQGYFSETRTLPQVVSRLHEQAIIAKTTSLSGPIAELVRETKLERKKVVEGKKELWGYRAA